MNIDERLERYATGERNFNAIELHRANLGGIVLREADLSSAN